MALNTQFSIAVHILAGIECSEDHDATSNKLANSVNTSASFVRRIISKLAKAGLVETTTGKAGTCRLAKVPKDISLLEVYRAVDAPKTFTIHTYKPRQACQVSRNIKPALGMVLTRSQQAFEGSLGKTSLAQVVSNLKED